jgi:hypothetical protein
MDEAAYLRLDVSGLRPRRGRGGGAVLTRVLADHRAGSTLTRSNMEERMLALCRRAGLATPLVNTKIQGYTVDFAWPKQRLIAEADGWQATGPDEPSSGTGVGMRTSRCPAGGWCESPGSVCWTSRGRVATQLKLVSRPSATDPAGPCRSYGGPGGPRGLGARRTAHRSPRSAVAGLRGRPGRRGRPAAPRPCRAGPGSA